MHDAKKTIAVMIGEMLREAAVLVGVFIPLDIVFTQKPLSRPLLVLGELFFLLCLGLGVAIERFR